MEKETYKIPSTVLNQLRDNLQKHADDVPKPKGRGMWLVESQSIDTLLPMDLWSLQKWNLIMRSGDFILMELE